MSNEGGEESFFVPCELCNELIRFEEYEQHVTACQLQTFLRNQRYIIYRDDEDNRFYRINITPALDMFHRLQITASNGDDTNPTDSDADNSSNDEDADPDTTFIPTRLNHNTLTVVPRIIPLEPSYVELNDNNYELNSLISEVLGPVRVGLADISLCLSKVEDAELLETCPICQDIIPGANFVKTLCKHSYCSDCITKWFAEHVSCPVCNKDQRELIGEQNESEKNETQEI